MNARKLDTISKLFANRRASAPVLAQVATPAVEVATSSSTDPHPGADEATHDPEYLFIQAFDGGSWAPKDGEEGTYALTLTGGLAQTVYFSDRPDRIFGQLTTSDFLANLGFTPDNPPNAAVVAPRADGSGDEMLVIELLNPAYDGETLTYDATVLADYSEIALAHVASQQAGFTLPESFGEGGLFIDGSSDCPEKSGQCYQEVNGQVVVVGDLLIPFCSKHVITCGFCNDDGRSSYYGTRCAEAHPDTCSYGTQVINGQTMLTWDCFGRGAGL